ncbi:MAG: DNA mismatch repair protein MutS, partial [Chloroflexota bacterium]|nr:DNA mismatch repair protein MutS [Chloroflexota bacterium]
MTTPIRQQYLAIKRQYPDVLLFFRLGDFYETFEEDARIAARVLDITLTARELGRGHPGGGKLPMAGVPYHSAEAHIAKLIAAGYKVAICEQIGQPTKGRDLVERRVMRVVTPGTVVEESMLPGHANNYLAAALIEGPRAGVAYADVTTGEFATTQLAARDADAIEAAVAQELLRLAPAEVLLPREDDPDAGADVPPWLPAGAHPSRTDAREWRLDRAEETLREHFEVAALDGFGCAGQPLAIRAAGALLQYLAATRPAGGLEQIAGLHAYSTDAYMALDAATRRNLELTEAGRGGQGSRGGSLLATIDRTRTPMGARLLRRWLGQPLVDLPRLLARQDAVERFARDALLRAHTAAALAGVGDLERLIGRATVGAATPRDLASLGRSLARLPDLVDALDGPGQGRDRGRAEAREGADSTDDENGETGDNPLAPWVAPLRCARCAEVAATIAAAIADDPPAALGTGTPAIRPGFAPELDELRRAAREAKAYIAGLERTERERTGIKSLKVGYNKVFGYYLEVGQASRHLVPEGYIRKQTLVGAERFITPELKEYEGLVTGAEERIEALEGAIYRQTVEGVAGAAPQVARVADALAHLDSFAGLATVAVERRYVRPTLRDGGDCALRIEGGRHPTVEATLAAGGPAGAGEAFVPNDTALDTAERQIMLITGPNMAGKSTYLRQVALIVLLAQIGSFVPADRAEIGLVDRIFTRIGAQDDLTAGQSTFMVEMLETAAILHSATRRSLIVLDEIGRGTSTYDGLAIARAVVEYIHNTPRLGCRTLFATHYHELTALADLLPRVHNERMDVLEEGDRVVFLRRVVPGGADRSYGIHVAGLAGMPRAVVRRAGEILAELEGGGAAPGRAAG